MEEISQEQRDFDTAQIALALLVIRHLNNKFSQTFSDSQKRTLLTAAADVLDRTVPADSLKVRLREASTHQVVDVLIENRNDIALVPPGLWHKARTAPNDLGDGYAAWRALERLQKMTLATTKPGDIKKAADIVLSWVSSTMETEPELAREASLLSTIGQQQLA